MNIRDYAEGFKQGIGMALGAYETVLPLPAADQKPTLTTMLDSAMKAGLVIGFPPSLSASGLTDFVFGIGPTLQKIYPTPAQ